MRKTPTHQLAEMRLGQDLATYITQRREAGKSWRAITAELTDDCGISVSHESLRSWFLADQTRGAA